MESKALVPVQQALVPFHGYGVLSVRLPDDHVATSHSDFCHMLDVARHGQIERIRRDKELSEHLVLVRVETAGGPQNIEVLIVDAIPDWVLGIQINKLAPEKRPLLLALRAEAFDVFYGYFFGAGGDQAANPALEEPAAPHTTRPRREKRQSASPWELIYGGLEMLATGMEGLEQEHQAMSSEIEILKGQFAEMQQWREGQGTAGPAPQRARVLSMDHLIQLTVLAEALRSRTGEPIKAIYADLSSAFGVEEVIDIPDAGWQTVLSWLWQRGQH
jgi:hypothetical protein